VIREPLLLSLRLLGNTHSLGLNKGGHASRVKLRRKNIVGIPEKAGGSSNSWRACGTGRQGLLVGQRRITQNKPIAGQATAVKV